MFQITSTFLLEILKIVFRKKIVLLPHGISLKNNNNNKCLFFKKVFFLKNFTIKHFQTKKKSVLFYTNQS